MLTQQTRSLSDLSTQSRIIPIVESRTHFEQVCYTSDVTVILLRHCNLFEFTTLLEQAHQRGLHVYVNVDHVDGVNPDAAGLRFLAKQLHIVGIVSNHPKTLALGKNLGLETIQRVFAMDSTGLESALESVDTRYVDLLDISPALVIPYIMPSLSSALPLPFIGSGLIRTAQQAKAVLDAGALRVAVMRNEF